MITDKLSFIVRGKPITKPLFANLHPQLVDSDDEKKDENALTMEVTSETPVESETQTTSEEPAEESPSDSAPVADQTGTPQPDGVTTTIKSVDENENPFAL